MKKKVLLLGSDFGSYDVVIEAHKMGLYVIATDLMDWSPTKAEADEAWMISTTDIDVLEQKCRENDVKAVLYGASDFNITQGRELCKRLGLPLFCSDDYGWKVARDKSEFKKVCESVGAPVAKGYKLTDALSREELDKIIYPVVIKPVDKSGNRGMSYCHNEEELVAAYHKAREVSDNPTIVCERMLHGDEWVVNYVLTNGVGRMIYFGRELHEHDQAANLYSMILTSANHLKVWNEEVEPYIQKFFKTAGFVNGIAWFECMFDEDGHFYLIEPGYRFSSETSYALYEKVDGFNSVRWYIEDALGVKHTEADLPIGLNKAYREGVASYHLFSTKAGIIHTIEGLEKVQSMENVVVDLPKREGEKVADHANMGLIRVYGKNIEEIIDKYKAINAVFSIKDERGENMFIRFDEYDQMREEFNAGLEQFGVKE